MDVQDGQGCSKPSIEYKAAGIQPSEKPNKSRAGSIDEKTLNDPDSFLREEREAVNAAIHEPGRGKDDFPDGGLRAWLVVFGVSCYVSSVRVK